MESDCTLNTSTNTNTSGSTRSTVCTSGTQLAISWMIVGRLNVLWFRIRASILYLWRENQYTHYPELLLVRLTRNFCDGSCASKKDLNMRWHSECISGTLAVHEADTGTKRWVYLELDVDTIDRQFRSAGVNDEAHFVWVTPNCFTFCTCVVTSLTGSTGGLHEINIT